MTNEERQAVIDSIHHWEVNILKHYDSFNKEKVERIDHIDELKISCSYCALCQFSYYHNVPLNTSFVNCNLCPWYKFSNKRCFQEELSDFYNALNIETNIYRQAEINSFNAKKVIGKLWSIGCNERYSDFHYITNYKYYYYIKSY